MRFEVFILTLLFSILDKDAELMDISSANAQIETPFAFSIFLVLSVIVRSSMELPLSKGSIPCIV